MNQNLDIIAILRLLARRWRVIVTVVGLCTGASVAASFGLPPRYTAVATLLIEGTDPEILQSQSVVKTPRQDRPLIETNIQLLSTSTFLREIVDILNLLKDPEFNPALPGGPRLTDLLEDRFIEFLDQMPPQAAFAQSWIGPADLSSQMQMESTLNRLRENLVIEQAGEAYTIRVRFTSFYPNRAAQVANQIVKQYEAQQLEDRRKTTIEAASFLEARLGELRDRAAASQAAVAKLMQAEGLSSSSTQDPLLWEINQLSAQMVGAQINRVQTDAELDRVRDLVNTESEQGGFLFATPLLLSLREEESSLRKKMAELGVTYGEQHPVMKNLVAQLTSVQDRVKSEIGRIIGDYESKARIARAQEHQLRQRYDELTGQARGQQVTAVKVQDLQRQADADRAIYTEFLTRYKQVMEEPPLVGPGVKVVSLAQPPAIPSFPPKALFITGSFGTSLVLGLIIAFIVELVETTLYSARQIERMLGITSLVYAPAIRQRQLQKLPIHAYLHSNPTSHLANVFRTLMVELLQTNLEKPPQVLLVTSALPEEGKTTIAACLAVTASKNGFRTVIVDLDLHRPRLRQLFGISDNVPGVVEVLTGEETLDDALPIALRDPEIRVLSVRRGAANSTGLLTSRRMTELIASLRQGFEVVILDTPPTLAVGDARILASFADTLLFVVRWGRTKADAARSGLEALGDVSPKIAGAVFNQVNIKRHAKRLYGDSIQYYRRYARYYQD